MRLEWHRDQVSARAAERRLRRRCGERNDRLAQRLAADGLRVIEGDATDLDFWYQLRHSESVRITVLAMPRHGVDIAFNVHAGAGLELADHVSNDETPREPVESAGEAPRDG